MAATLDYLALDLGAESGRGLLGRFDGSELALEEDPPLPQRPGADAGYALLGPASAVRRNQDGAAEGGRPTGGTRSMASALIPGVWISV